MLIKSWSITDVGVKRDHNEDSHFCDDDLKLYIVADGMGGHQAGETASRIAVEVIERELREKLETFKPVKEGGTRMLFVSNDPIIRLLTEAVQAASAAILDRVEEERSLSGMGTTVTSLLFHDDKAYYAHVGDSRLYRLRGDDITRITTDHSLVQEQLDAGLITAGQVAGHSLKNIITRSVGFERDIPVDCEEVDQRPGDTFLLCSDGLSNPVSEEEMWNIIMPKDPETALQFFINLANSRGGDDNTTAILVRLEEDESS